MISRFHFSVAFLMLAIGPLFGSGGEDVAEPPSLAEDMALLPRKAFFDVQSTYGNNIATDWTQAVENEDVINAFSKGPSFDLTKTIDGLILQCRKSDSFQRGNSQDPAPALSSNRGYRVLDSDGSHDELNALENLRDVAASNGGTAQELTDYAKWRIDNNHAPKPELLEEIRQHFAAASPKIKPGWLYLEGAAYYNGGKFAEASTKFQEVIDNPEGAPYAEMALFMKARALHNFPDPGATDSAPSPDSKAKVLAAYQAYLDKYPNGRFASDAWGWLGGLEPDSVTALLDFYKQATFPDHPETVFSASNEMERISENADFSQTDFTEISKVPKLALFMCYLGVGNHLKQPFLENLSKAVIANQNLYTSLGDKTQYLAILAHAASDSGDQTSALKVVSLAQANGPMNDDLFFVKSLILQRSNRLVAAVDCYRDMLNKFPNSPLAQGARYRLALALHDEGKNGEALEALYQLQYCLISEPTQFAPSLPDGAGITTDQLKKTIDCIIKFSPLESLLPPLSDKDPDAAKFRGELGKVVVARYLAMDDFKSAAQWTSDPIAQAAFLENARAVDQINSSTFQNPSTKGILASQLGDFWEQREGTLSSPDFLMTQDQKTDLENADVLHFSKDIYLSEVPKRDELKHACQWWQQVWQLDPQNFDAPHALWKTIQAQRIFVQNDPQLGGKPEETLVRGLYDKLTQGFPNSLEAIRYAVYWTFPPPPPAAASDVIDYEAPIRHSIRDIVYPNLVLKDSDGDTKDVSPQYEDTSLEPWFKSLQIEDKDKNGAPLAAAQNVKDELEDLAQVPHLDENFRTKYTAWIQGTGDYAAVDDGGFVPDSISTDPNAGQIADFIDAHRVITGQMEPEEFLGKYPHSPRREVALFKIIKRDVHANPLKVEPTEVAFQNYAKECPDNHLKRAVLYLRGIFEEEQHHWGEAVNDYYQLIQQTRAPELHLDAAAHISFIFEKLNQDELRREILDSVQKDATARQALRGYAQAGESPYLTDYLTNMTQSP